MKETEITTKDQVEIVNKKEVEKQLKYLGSMNPNPSHTMFEYEVEANVLRKAKFVEDAANFVEVATSKKVGKVKRIDVKDNCLYVSKLNAKAAIKFFQILLNNLDINPTIEI
jgi:hypothetical protein